MQIVKKLVLGLSLLIFLSLAYLLIFADRNEDKLAEKIMNTIEQEITTSFQKEAYEISLFKNFPFATATFSNVKIEGTDGDIFLAAEELSLRLSLTSLLKNKTEIENVYLKNAQLLIHDQGKGKRNYEIFRKNEKEGGAQFSLNFKKAIFEEVGLKYINTISKHQHEIQIANAEIKGLVNEDYIQLDLAINSKSKYFSIDKIKFLKQKPLEIKGGLEVHMDEGLYHLDQLIAGISDNQIVIDGSIQNKNGHDFYNLDINCKNGNFESLAHIIPTEIQQNLKTKDIKGRIDLDAEIKGRKSKKENPQINVVYQGHNMIVNHSLLESPLEQVSFHGNFTNGLNRNFKTSQLNFKNIKGKGQAGKIKAEAQLLDFTNPTLDLNLEGSVPAGLVIDLLQMESNFPKTEGKIEVQDLVLNDFELNEKERSNIYISGKGVIDQVKLFTGRDWLHIANGKIDVKEEQLIFESITLKQGKTDLVLNGNLDDLPSIYKNGNLSEATFLLNTRGKRLELDKFLVAIHALDPAVIAQSKGPKTKRISLKEKHWKTPYGKINLNVDAFSYLNFNATDFTSALDFLGYQIEVKSEMKSMEGKIKQDGLVHLNPNINLISNLELDKVNLTTCFNQMNNFDQKVITANHLKGDINAKCLLDVSWDHQGEILDDRMELKAAMQINDGHLKDFEMLERFANYIHVEDLKNIKFEQINNLIEIKNRKVIIPVMFLQSNACNLTVQGIHTFDNDILYNMKVNAGQVLGKKFQKRNKDLRPTPAKRRGWLNLYYHLYGNVQDFEYKAKPKVVKSNFDQSDEHRIRIREALIDAFGYIPLISEPIEWMDIPEYDQEIEEEDSEPEYIEGFQHL